MHAFIVRRYGSPLERAQIAEPEVGDRDVLVQVHAAGLNHLDEKIRTGEFRAVLPYRLPVALGNELAGVVVAVGPDVRRFAVGDAVFGRPSASRIGTLAERIAVAEDDLALAPTSIDTDAAGSLPLVALTAWQALVERAALQPGQKVLIHAGAGGVGTIAIQLAKHLGATVATTVSARDLDFARDLGADIVLDYANDDFSTLSDFDVVIDSVGGVNLERSLRVLKRGGTAISIVGPPDPAFARQQGLNPLVTAIFGVLSRSIRRQAAKLGVDYSFLFMRADGAQLEQIARLVDEGVIRPVVGEVVDFDDTAHALQALGTRRTRGRTVVRVSPASAGAPSDSTTMAQELS